MTNEKSTIPNAVPAFESKPLAHSMANLFYWLSFFLLLVAMRMIIDPSNRKAGMISHIYITLGSFELYMWMLIVLGRWQLTRLLKRDAVRSFCFTMVLCGFLFMILNELYLAAKSIQTAYVLTAIALISTTIKISWMCKLAKIKLTAMQWMFALGWLGLIAGAAPIFEGLADTPRFIGSIGLCWIITLFLTCHLVLVRQQRNNGFVISRTNIFESWPAGWTVLGILIVCAIGQAASVTYVFAGWSYWYFSPIFVTLAIVAIALTRLAKTAQPLAWGFLVASLIFMLAAAGDSLPKGFPSDARMIEIYSTKSELVESKSIPIPDDEPNMVASYVETYQSGTWYIPRKVLTHPIYPTIAYGSFVFALAALTTSCWWLLIFAVAAPLSGLIFKSVKLISTGRNGKGFAVLLLAFLLLGGGVLLQWSQEKWGQKPKEQEMPELEIDDTKEDDTK